MPAAVTTFAGHKNGEVTSISAFSPSAPFTFASADNRGFALCWDARSASKPAPASASMPFLRSVGAGTEIVHIASADFSQQQQQPQQTTVCVCESHAAAIDWRNPKAPLWTVALDELLPATGRGDECSGGQDAFARAMWSGAPTAGEEVMLFTDDGNVFAIDTKTAAGGHQKDEQQLPALKRWAPPEFSRRQDAQVPCGAALFAPSHPLLQRWTVFASTLGELSLIDTVEWMVAGSCKVGGLKDDAGDAEQGQEEDCDHRKKQHGQLTNPPLLASLDVIQSPFSSALTQGRPKEEDDDQDEDNEDNDDSHREGRGRKNSADALPSLCALIARADGAAVFAHVEAPRSSPVISRLIDTYPIGDGSGALCSAHWISSASSSLFQFAAVPRCGLVALWTIPAKFLDPSVAADQEEEGAEDGVEGNGGGADVKQKEEEALLGDLRCVETVVLRDQSFGATDVQRAASEGADITCSTRLTSFLGVGAPNFLAVGDSAGRIMAVNLFA